MTTRRPVEVASSLGSDDLERVRALVADAATVDGASALNEATWLQVTHPSEGSTHLLVRSGDGLAGYAHLDHVSGLAEGVVHPEHRRAGLAASIAASAKGATSAWAHGDHPGAAALARAARWAATRSLHQMRLDLIAARLPEPDWPDGVTMRTFVPGADDEAWLAVNAAAFADHPEQGGLTQTDLDQRLTEEWFDASGFFLAERGETLLGYHWTKVHPDGAGEIYVLGVAPDAQGSGLGTALALQGLRHLRSAGASSCLLYVESDNVPAVRTYERLGFEVASTDVLYTRS